MKQLTFLWTDPKLVKGPYTFARLRELASQVRLQMDAPGIQTAQRNEVWRAGTINAESKLFLTERDEANKVQCFPLRAADIQENLKSGAEIDVKGLCARVTARDGR